APDVDYLGNDRPYDGDRDGQSDYDLGAVEYGSSQSVFVDVSADTGFNLVNRSGPHRGSGLHWGDLDNDGDLDAIVTGVGSAVLINNGQTFSAYPLADGQAWRQGALLDADTDGDLDFFASCNGSFKDETLFVNDGTGSFTDTGDAGFVAASNNEGLAAADLDADGSPDLVMFSENGNWRGINATSDGTIDFDAENDVGDGLAESNLAGNGDFVSTADVNDDGYLDFFYHYANGRLFVSDGRGGFNADDSAITVATGNSIKFGSAWGDFDNDGDMDLFTPSRSSGVRGALFEDNGSAYVNIAGSVGLTNATVQYSAAWGDYDNDGDLDLLIATGARAPAILYANNGDGTFSEADDGPTIDGLVQDIVFVDYDNDGDLDIAATRPGATDILLKNTLDNNTYLKARAVYLTSAGVPVDVIGARIELLDQAGTLLARREVGAARGYGGTEPLWAHFGGVDPALPYTVRVTWPGGATTSAQIIPEETSSTIGGRTISQMVTMTKDFPAAVRVVNWREISPADR
ncbi:MAG TPA: CRTAC1 family protein, partial [Phycisphaerales bacterium]|nr:CRTAC1 family protein [Phycisphaerales bacterium]